MKKYLLIIIILLLSVLVVYCDKKDTEDVLLNNMSLDEKIGQLVIVGFMKDASEQQISDYMAKYKVSGFILFKRNFANLQELYVLNEKLKKLNSVNKLPLFISMDEEGGTVSRLPKEGTHFQDMSKVGKINDIKLTEKIGQVIGSEFKSVGINMNFAPVLDISGSDNKLLAKRVFGNTPEIVTAQGTSFIKGLESKNIIAVPKHFPGHGATNLDSHGILPKINISKETLVKRELVPYKAAIANGLDAVMVGHLAYPKIDPSGLPATMSSIFLKDILRDQLKFKGLVITDEIEMIGFSGNKMSFDESIIKSFNAGVDIFVIGHTYKTQQNVIAALKKGVIDKKISEARLNESVQRIITTKKKYNIIDKMEYTYKDAAAIMGSKENGSVYKEVQSKIAK